MPKYCRGQCPVEWNIRSISVRKRDAQHRVAQVYRRLLDGCDQEPAYDSKPSNVFATNAQEEDDAHRHLRQSLNGSSTTEPDH